MRFTKKYLEFLEKEFDIDEQTAEMLDEDELDSLYDDVCAIEEIEAYEASVTGDKISERGRIATELVDFIWKSRNGSYQPDDDFDVD